jgi:hypothetical protein
MMLAPIALRENCITLDLPSPKVDVNDESIVTNSVGVYVIQRHKGIPFS